MDNPQEKRAKSQHLNNFENVHQFNRLDFLEFIENRLKIESKTANQKTSTKLNTNTEKFNVNKAINKDDDQPNSSKILEQLFNQRYSKEQKGDRLTMKKDIPNIKVDDNTGNNTDGDSVQIESQIQQAVSLAKDCFKGAKVFEAKNDSRIQFKKLEEIPFLQKYANEKTLSKSFEDIWNCLSSSNLFYSLKESTIAIVPGRIRVFMGHTDFEGLGGPTLDVTTSEELLMFATLLIKQKGENENEVDSTHNEIDGILAFNCDSLYAPSFIDMQDLKNLIAHDNALSSKNDGSKKRTTALWPQDKWDSFLKAVCARIFFSNSKIIATEKKDEELITGTNVSNNKPKDFNRLLCVFVNSKLPTSGGLSSSAALTGAFSLSLNSLLNLGLTMADLLSIDYCENTYLGRNAGSGDKAAILLARQNCISVMWSFPVIHGGYLRIPEGLRILMVQSSVPRLTSPEGREYLLRKFCSGGGKSSTKKKDDNDNNSYFSELKRIDRIQEWARNIFREFGGTIYSKAGDYIIRGLKNSSLYIPCKITDSQAETVLNVLEQSQKFSASSNSNNNTGAALLRELCCGGLLEDYYKGRENRFNRYKLIYRVLKLVPEGRIRNAALYGISETERCSEYLYALKKMIENGDSDKENEVDEHFNDNDDATDDNGNDKKKKKKKKNEYEKYLRRVLSIVRSSHNGDRAVVDYRHDFKPTKWAAQEQEEEKKLKKENIVITSNSDDKNKYDKNSNDNNDDSEYNINNYNHKNKQLILSNEILEQWAGGGDNKRKEEGEVQDIALVCGSFQRSIPEFDEAADSLREVTQGKAELRVAAAGLGGTICVHTVPNMVEIVREFCTKKGWEVKELKTGSAPILFRLIDR